jgi:hypothetical protein
MWWSSLLAHIHVAVTPLSRRNEAVSDYFAKRLAADDLYLLARALTEPVDSTGVKIYGEGEWLDQKHRVWSRRRWRKLHLAIDANTQEVAAVELTPDDVGDGSVQKVGGSSGPW